MMTGVRKSSFYDIPNPTKVVIVVENTPSPFGHGGIVFEDNDGNTLGYNFGAWPTKEDKHGSTNGPGRMIVEKNGYRRVERYGGTKFILDMTPAEIQRMKDFHTDLEKNGTLMERPDDIYDDIERKVEINSGRLSKYNIWTANNGENCIRHVIEAAIYAYGEDSPKGKYLRNLTKLASINPGSFERTMKKDGIMWGVVKDYEEKF